MSKFGQWRRDALFVAFGLAVGLSVAGAWAAFQGARPEQRSVRPVPLAVAATVSPTDPAKSAEELPAPRRRGAGRADAANRVPDWTQAADVYRAPDGNLTRARSFLYRLDPKGLRKLAQAATTWPVGRRTMRAMRDIFQQWARLDPGAALDAARTYPPPYDDTAVWSSINGFCETQPAQAVAFLAKPPDPNSGPTLTSISSRRLMLGSALMSWSEQDAAAAASFFEGLPAYGVSTNIAARIAEEWTRQDPAAALNWATRLVDQGARAEAERGVLTTWATTDPQAAANRVLTLTGEPGQDELAGALVRDWATHDLPAAARWAAAQGGAVQAKAVAAVASQWTDQDPAAAAAWAGQLPAGAMRDEAYARVATGWADRDPAAAEGWLTTLPPGSERDAALAQYSETSRDSGRAVEMVGWAEKIGDSRQRDDAVAKVLKEWAEDQPQDARRWINQANLPDTVLNQLPKEVTRQGG